MISRLTTFAAVFAIVTTASLAYAANVQQERRAAAAACETMPIVQLERVVVTGHRTNLVASN
jgi:hypothetical protein